MCTGSTADVICVNTMCAVSLTNHLRAVADAFEGFILCIEHLSGEFHKSEVLLTDTTLLVVKAESIYRNTTKMYKPIKTEFSH